MARLPEGYPGGRWISYTPSAKGDLVQRDKLGTLYIYIYYTYNLRMDVIWDPAKGRINWKKHGVFFSDAEVVLWDPYARTIEDPEAEDEQRFITLGSDALGRVLVVIYTYDKNSIRLISARQENISERRKYEKFI